MEYEESQEYTEYDSEKQTVDGVTSENCDSEDDENDQTEENSEEEGDDEEIWVSDNLNNS